MILFNFVGQAIDLAVTLIIFYVSRIWFPVGIIGIFGSIVSATMMFSFVATFGIDIVHVKMYNEAETPEERNQRNGVYARLKIIQFIVQAILLFSNIIYSDVLSNYFTLSIVMAISTMMYFGYSAFIQILLQCEKKVIKIRLGTVLGTSLRLISLFFLFLAAVTPIDALVYSYFLQACMVLAYGLLNIRSFHFAKPPKELYYKYFKTFYPFIFSTVVAYLMQNITMVWLYKWYSVGELGNYFTALQLYQWVLLFPPLINDVLLPTLSAKDLSSRQTSEFLILKTHRYMSIIIFLLASMSFTFAEPVIVFLFGIDYALCGKILNILLLSRVFELFSLAYVTELRAKGHVLFSEMMQVLNLVLFLIFTYLFVNPTILSFGTYGAAFATLFSAMLFWIIFDLIVCLKYKYKFFWGVLKLFAIFGIIISINYLIYHFLPVTLILKLAIEGVIALGIFGAGLFLFKVLKPDDIEILKKAIQPKLMLDEIKSQIKKD